MVRNIFTAMLMATAALSATQSVGDARSWLEACTSMHHGGFPVVNESGVLVGVITRREIVDARVAAVREAADHMVNHAIGRLPVVERAHPSRIVGIVTRSDVMSVFQRRVARNPLRSSCGFPGRARSLAPRERWGWP